MVTPSYDRMMPSRDVCTPRALSDQDERRWTIRYFAASTNARGDRGNLHSEIAANPVQGSSTVTGSHEGEGGAWRLLFIFLICPRRPNIPRQDSLTRGSGRPIEPTRRMKVRSWFGSAVLACSIHSFLGGGDKQPVELLADEDRVPRSVADTQMDGMTASGAKRPVAQSAYFTRLRWRRIIEANWTPPKRRRVSHLPLRPHRETGLRRLMPPRLASRSAATMRLRRHPVRLTSRNRRRTRCCGFFSNRSTLLKQRRRKRRSG